MRARMVFSRIRITHQHPGTDIDTAVLRD